ncbi:hypothetical protein IAG41_03305 [Sphingomonas sp. JC676]|uniref:hypothetical protein n=1 Tax=Sphingomonas sp. JC676 TaxID=2768065 RepID=UPI0016580E55|nr:hypothetical protein [Sphingomonas sp. JC676]MBC9031411.1 hypothetical protein [Sphingomonas sp. JC676]
MPEWMYRDVWNLHGVPLDELKALWDEYDGSNCPGGFSGEAIHLVLNLRGHGAYCPV